MSVAIDMRPGFARALMPRLTGRMFVHPVFDYLLIGGGLSLLVSAIVLWRGGALIAFSNEFMAYILVLSNTAHFASSTVRLYTKPGTTRSLPFLTLAFPFVTLAVLTLCIVFAGQLGPHLQSLYLTWSPFHYSAQAYGLAVMYSYRSGCALQPADKRLLRWVATLPFLAAFINGPSSGVHWLLPNHVFQEWPALMRFQTYAFLALGVVAGLSPLVLMARVWRSSAGPMPLISVLVVITNGFWWFVLPARDAFVWATVFHGIQYLAIVIIFDVKDQMSRPGNRHGPLYHAVFFYGASLLLAYGLFKLLPMAFFFAGFGLVESWLLVVAVINIHHFIVDGFIWKLRPSDSNRRLIDSGAFTSAPGPTSA
jgi:hypothetical protein